MRALFFFALVAVHCGGASVTATATTTAPSSRPAAHATAAQVTPLPCPTGDVNACTAACDAGKMGACTTLGGMLHDAGDARASAILERACNGGDPRGCATLAYYDKTRRDALFTKAFATYKSDCTAGRAESCSLLAHMTEAGLGATADAAEAKRLEEKVSSLYRAACDAGEAASCHALAERMSVGLGVAVDKDAANALDERACAANVGEACLFLATNAAYTAPQKDLAKAATLSKKSCELGHAAGCSFLGELTAKGEGTARDPAAALALFVRACQGPGNLRIGASCNDAGVMLAEGDVPHDEARATTLFGEACRLGYMNGCFELGRSYARARGVAKDPRKAIELLAKVCDESTLLPVACSEAGYVYQSEPSVKDPAKALQLYKRACDAGSGAGCNNLGMAYVTSMGVAKDEVKAADFLMRSCELKFVTGCVNIAELALDHRGGPRAAMNDAAITRIFDGACNAGVMVGCNDLAYMFRSGRAGKKDAAKARELFDKACRGGFQVACENAKVR
jgi:TPR repeat protein